MAYQIKNWQKFQHYKDRKPAWIKLHRDLLNDRKFFSLPIESRAILPLLWIIASENEGELPDQENVAWRLRVKHVDYTPFVKLGFITEETNIKKQEKWANRHIPSKVRKEMMNSDSCCAACGAKTKLEVDHIVPISKGGTSDRKNLQVLCRSCNRRKRNKIQKELEQVATQDLSQCSLEVEVEVESREETEKSKQKNRNSELYEKQADEILTIYAKIKKPKMDNSRGRAKTHIVKLLEFGESFDDMILSVKNFMDIEKNKDQQFIRSAGNFFGKDQDWRFYIKEDITQEQKEIRDNEINDIRDSLFPKEDKT